VEPLKSLRGMVDLLPASTMVWQRIEVVAREHFRRAGLAEIRTPLLEVTELFARGIGVETIALAWALLADLCAQGLALELNCLGNPEHRARSAPTWCPVPKPSGTASSPTLSSAWPATRCGCSIRRIPPLRPCSKAHLLEGDALIGDGGGAFEQVRQCHEALAIPFELNPRLLRGLDYFGHAAFEITSRQVGSHATLSSGDRYGGSCGGAGRALHPSRRVRAGQGAPGPP
jgi:histidyl-tRNA synthetase